MHWVIHPTLKAIPPAALMGEEKGKDQHGKYQRNILAAQHRFIGNGGRRMHPKLLMVQQGFKFLLTIPFAKEQRIPKANSPKRGPPTMPKMLRAACGRKRVYQALHWKS